MEERTGQIPKNYGQIPKLCFVCMFFPVFVGCHAEHFGEVAAETAYRRETGGERNLFDRARVGNEQAGMGIVDTVMDDVVLDTHTGIVFQGAGQVMLVGVEGLYKFFAVEIGIGEKQVFAHHLFRPVVQVLVLCLCEFVDQCVETRFFLFLFRQNGVRLEKLLPHEVVGEMVIHVIGADHQIKDGKDTDDCQFIRNRKAETKREGEYPDPQCIEEYTGYPTQFQPFGYLLKVAEALIVDGSFAEEYMGVNAHLHQIDQSEDRTDHQYRITCLCSPFAERINSRIFEETACCQIENRQEDGR